MLGVSVFSRKSIAANENHGSSNCNGERRLIRKYRGRSCGRAIIDPISRAATKDGRSINLTESEFQILYALSSEAGKIFTRSELLQSMNPQADLVERNVDVHVSSLRKKMGPDGGRILTIRNVGYRFMEDDEFSRIGTTN